MKKLYKLIGLNILVSLVLVVTAFSGVHLEYLFFPLALVTMLNLYLLYKKSNSMDEQEIKKKIMLHQIKNSLSVILGYSEALNDNVISKDEFEQNLKLEIDKMVNSIRSDLYK
ncbi:MULTISPECIES: hypothetical protein [unclassified Gemella]|uniref:hypothetical protein n=1 Tax=unclassified Gemella TaxID=2624949 RepID=UPI0010746A6B|nr:MULTISPECIES: hypothetical protein [unclassified Gemella]MBF0710069.1 hypothetical protein [Gemella sp. GL1.1]MBF0746148.1 hypothetical protein [Gemella sp. 19428wG2_WT2a]MBF0849129.1 hypothetical protein [Streptococcus danieliae]NYS27413.1 hypothetical protein [Gemella sp. GL1]